MYSPRVYHLIGSDKDISSHFSSVVAIDSISMVQYNSVMKETGKHIVVYGPACSGKTTLARQISHFAGLSHIELDEIFWQPGWEQKSLEEFRAGVSATLNGCPEGWIADGNYSRVRDLILPQADTVIWLRPSFSVAFWRLLKRTVTRCREGTLLWGTNYESWRKAFLSRDSLLLYQVKNWRRYDSKVIQDLKKIPNQATIIQLRSQREIDAFLMRLRY